MRSFKLLVYLVERNLKVFFGFVTILPDFTPAVIDFFNKRY